LVLVVAVVDEYTRSLLTEPEIISRGFAYLKENQTLNLALRTLVEEVIDDCARGNAKDWLYDAKTSVREALSRYIFEQTKRSPMIITVIKNI